MLEIEQYLQAGDIELRAEDIKILLEEHNNMKQDIKRLKEEYMILQNASDEVEEEKDREIERLNNIINEFDNWLDVNLFNLEKENANNTYDEGLKQGMLANGRLIKNKLQELKGSDKE